MYNDEQNLYHYTYRKDGSESGQQNAGPAGDGAVGTVQSEPQRPIQEMKPVKKNRMGLKVTALALCCALLGGALGGGIVWGVSRATSEATVQVSDRTVSQVSLKTVDGKTEMTDAEVYAANVNSVVSINVTGTNSNNFFGQPVQTASSGSGFILTTDGYIVTNYHVVEDAQTVKVTLYNGDEYDAQYVGGDEDYDIAVIKIEATGLPCALVGDSDKLEVGDEVVAVGNPLGELGGTVTNGIISALSRDVNIDGTEMSLIQTNAAVNPGNSGGGLFNMYGELIGIVNAKSTSTSSGTSVEGIGFAIPVATATKVAEELVNYGYVRGKVMLGITYVDIEDAYTAMRYRVNDLGLYIVSSEYTDDLKAGDRIVAIDDTQITYSSDIKSILKKHSVGDEITVKVVRDGQYIDVKVTLHEYVPSETSSETTAESGSTN